MAGKFENLLKKRVESLGGIYYKFTSPGRVGVSDRIAALPKGIVFWLEIKESGDKLRSRQVRELMRLKKLDQNVYVISSMRSIEAVTILMRKEIEDATHL